jgi:hypothetical protein
VPRIDQETTGMSQRGLTIACGLASEFSLRNFMTKNGIKPLILQGNPLRNKASGKTVGSNKGSSKVVLADDCVKVLVPSRV